MNIIRECTNFLSNIFQSHNKLVNWEEILDCVPTLITTESNLELTREVTHKEISEVMI